MNNKTHKLLVYILSNVSMALLLYFALNGSAGSQNVFCFVVWLGLVSVVGMSCSPDLQKAMAAAGKTRSVPNSIGQTVEIAFVITLIYFSWWWTGLAVLLTLLWSQSTWDRIEKLQKESADAPKV